MGSRGASQPWRTDTAPSWVSYFCLGLIYSLSTADGKLRALTLHRCCSRVTFLKRRSSAAACTAHLGQSSPRSCLPQSLRSVDRMRAKGTFPVRPHLEQDGSSCRRAASASWEPVHGRGQGQYGRRVAECPYQLCVCQAVSHVVFLWSVGDRKDTRGGQGSGMHRVCAKY
jgi:hypothetical protein